MGRIQRFDVGKSLILKGFVSLKYARHLDIRHLDIWRKSFSLVRVTQTTQIQQLSPTAPRGESDYLFFGQSLNVFAPALIP
jgi:hypothetical protein